MLAMFDVTEPEGGADAVTKKQGSSGVIDVKGLLDQDGDFLRAMVRAVAEARREAEMTSAPGVEKGEGKEGARGDARARLWSGEPPALDAAITV
jgi:hypothetical protein